MWVRGYRGQKAPEADDLRGPSPGQLPAFVDSGLLLHNRVAYPLRVPLGLPETPFALL